MEYLFWMEFILQLILFMDYWYIDLYIDKFKKFNDEIILNLKCYKFFTLGEKEKEINIAF